MTSADTVDKKITQLNSQVQILISIYQATSHTTQE